MSSPLDMVKALLDEQVIIKLRGNRELTGTLHAYDEHCNMILGQCEETVYTLEHGQIKTTKNNSEMLFVRGDSVILVRH